MSISTSQTTVLFNTLPFKTFLHYLMKDSLITFLNLVLQNQYATTLKTGNNRSLMYFFCLALWNSLKGTGSVCLLASPLSSVCPMLVVPNEMGLFESMLPCLANKSTGTRQLPSFLQNLSDFF